MSGRRAVGMIALVCVVATLTVAATQSSDDESAGRIRAGLSSHWRPLPALPTGSVLDVDGAAIASAHGQLYAAVVDRGRDPRQLSRVHTFRWRDNGWIRLGQLAVNRDEPFFLTGGRRACITATVRREVRARCVSAEQRSWRPAGKTIFQTTHPSARVALSHAFAGNGRLYVVRAETHEARTGHPRRLEHRVLRQDAAWRRLGARDIDPTTALGTQRVTGLMRDGRPCLVYDALSDDPVQGPSVQERCLDGNQWRATSTPPLSLDRVSATVRRGREAINVDGAASVDGNLFVGVDHFQPTRTNWPVYHTLGDGWQSAGFTPQPTGWNAQGSLYEVKGQLWAVRFDQRPSATGLLTRLVVLRRSRAGRVAQVGPALLENEPLRGPLYWGLVASGPQVYAAATVPGPAGRGNVFRVFALKR